MRNRACRRVVHRTSPHRQRSDKAMPGTPGRERFPDQSHRRRNSATHPAGTTGQATTGPPPNPPAQPQPSRPTAPTLLPPTSEPSREPDTRAHLDRRPGSQHEAARSIAAPKAAPCDRAAREPLSAQHRTRATPTPPGSETEHPLTDTESRKNVASPITPTGDAFSVAYGTTATAARRDRCRHHPWRTAPARSTPVMEAQREHSGCSPTRTSPLLRPRIRRKASCTVMP